MAAAASRLSRKTESERLWQESPAATWLSHSRTIEHPEIGALTLDCESGTPAYAGLELLRVIGTQRMEADA